MFGRAYLKLMPLEVFLRTLEPGIQNISDVREKLFFIPNRQFASILKESLGRNLIMLNKENGTIFLPIKVNNIIRFIEEFDFINVFDSYMNRGVDIEDEQLKSYLETTGFFLKSKSSLDVSDELNNCLKFIYREDYSSEVLNFRFFVMNEAVAKDREGKKDE